MTIGRGVPFEPGDLVYWHQSAKPGGWHAGRFRRVVQRGRHKGWCEVEVGGRLLAAHTVRIPPERLRARPGRDG